MNKSWPRATADQEARPQFNEGRYLPILAELEADAGTGGAAAG